MEHQAREELVESLLDLLHDLGKYLRLPLSFLPEQASAADVHEALHKALLMTHPPHSARDLWTSFLLESKSSLDEDATLAPAFTRLRESVDVALAWEASLAGPPEAIRRRAAERDLGAVAAAIRDLLEELKDG